MMTQPGLAGLLMRWALPTVVVLFVVLGFLRLAGEASGLFTSAQGTALFVLLRVLVIGAVILLAARAAHRIEAARDAAHGELGRLNAELEATVAERTSELRKLNEQLEQRIKDRTAALEVANRELEAFAYSVSHDLRAPLRSMDGFSLALLEDYRDKLDVTGQDYLRRVRSGSQRMAQLIDDMLNLSRVTRHEVKREQVDLSGMAWEIVQELRQAEPGRDIHVTVAQGLTADGDPALLYVVLRNLLGNAWKFTAGTPEATIEFGAVTQDAQTVYFVRDNGAGFDMAYASKLFTPFQRLHTTAEFSGTGIGLATVHRIISKHGGRVWAEGAVGKGATFYFTL
jgi:light-regulated signal transduction histidine kinase (bacteriophytochrome)